MSNPHRRALYRHTGVALLRAASGPVSSGPDQWPDLTDADSCAAWLRRVWDEPQFADAVRDASSSLASRADAMTLGEKAVPKWVRKVAVAVVRYRLRALGRPTPFGRFAGVARVSLGPRTDVRWGDDHTPVARVDAAWLADLTAGLEADANMRERLDVKFNDLAAQRGGRLEVPRGQDRVTVRYTRAVAAARLAATCPVRFGVLADKLADAFPHADRARIVDMLAELVREGVLITNLRAPFTIIDPLRYLLDQLTETGAQNLLGIGKVVRELEAVHSELARYNTTRDSAMRRRIRENVIRRMRGMSTLGRSPLAVDLRLDCALTIPQQVANEMELAATALLRLTPQPAGEDAWQSYHSAFLDRYGIGTIVPVRDAVNPDTGLGYPAGYPGSLLPGPAVVPTDRSSRLLTLAWRAIANGSPEITLTDELLDWVTTGDRFDKRRIPPHIELAARIHATSRASLDRGDYTLVVAPARAAGTLTSRFSTLATGTGLEQVYREVPTSVQGAIAVQMSFPPMYFHAENVCRVPAYLPHRLALGEYPADTGHGHSLQLNDLAVTATRDRLHLISISERRVVEPQVFHALALTKQAPTIARYLTHLSRGFCAAWYEFDWGAHAEALPYLPRVRYRRAVLSPARWRLTADDLTAGSDDVAWRQALGGWRAHHRWSRVVELRDADRTLRLDLGEPAHAYLLRAHVDRHGDAVLTEASPAEQLAWIDGHVHEVAMPLARRTPPDPAPALANAPVLRNADHGWTPAAPNAPWLYLKVHTHPERFDDVIASLLPRLIEQLDGRPAYWFVRYRSEHETDHLRLRISTPRQSAYVKALTAAGAWCQQLRAEALANRIVIDTYRPEVGRYGHGDVLAAAEQVFAADSAVVAAQLRHLPQRLVHPMALAAANLVAIVRHFLGDDADGMRWLVEQPAPGPTGDRAVADQAATLVGTTDPAPAAAWHHDVTDAWRARADALAAYHAEFGGVDTDEVLRSLLHMHHNRALGTDPESERTCLRLARHAALSWNARNGVGQQ